MQLRTVSFGRDVGSWRRYPSVLHFFSFESIFLFDLYQINYRYHALIQCRQREKVNYLSLVTLSGHCYLHSVRDSFQFVTHCIQLPSLSGNCYLHSVRDSFQFVTHGIQLPSLSGNCYLLSYQREKVNGKLPKLLPLPRAQRLRLVGSLK